jgi:hypothetical protein
VGAWAGFPIVTADNQPVGSMCVIDASPRKWTPGELETLATLARAVSNEVNLRVALQVTRAALESSEESLASARALARSLQDSLLPPVLRPAPGLDAAARYLPATAGGEPVTGDFYDLFQARGPWWIAVMGDVCGKGTEAAKVTALARYTLRADAGDHLSPAEALSRLNASMLAQGAPLFLTAVGWSLLADGDRGLRLPGMDQSACLLFLVAAQRVAEPEEGGCPVADEDPPPIGPVRPGVLRLL